MFKKFFAALAALINNTQNLADSFREADNMVREKFGLSQRSDNDIGQLEHKEESPKLKSNKQ